MKGGLKMPTVLPLAVDLSSIGDTLAGQAETAVTSAANAAAPVVAIIIGVGLLFRFVKRFTK